MSLPPWLHSSACGETSSFRKSRNLRIAAGLIRPKPVTVNISPRHAASRARAVTEPRLQGADSLFPNSSHLQTNLPHMQLLFHGLHRLPYFKPRKHAMNNRVNLVKLHGAI